MSTPDNTPDDDLSFEDYKLKLITKNDWLPWSQNVGDVADMQYLDGFLKGNDEMLFLIESRVLTKPTDEEKVKELLLVFQERTELNKFAKDNTPDVP